MSTQDSILDSVKKVSRVAPEDTAFDVDFIMHINSVFADLNQLGVGPYTVFEITDKEATWAQFIGENHAINAVRSYMCNRVRLLFDPPANSFGIEALKGQIKEHEWRLLVAAEEFRDNRTASAISPVTLATLASIASSAPQVTEETG